MNYDYADSKNSSNRLILVLLLLRYIVLVLINMMGFNKQIIWAIYDVGTYLLLGVLLWIERDKWDALGFHWHTLLLFVFAKCIEPIRNNIYGSNRYMQLGNIGGNLIAAISIVFLVVIISNRHNIIYTYSESFFKTTLYGIIYGILALLLIYSPVRFLNLSGNAVNAGSFIKESFISIIFNVATQLAYAALSEEPLYRGIIFNAMKEKKHSNVVIVLFQVAIFTLAHLYYFPNKLFSLLVIIPVATFTITLSRIKSKSITGSIITHAIINGLGPIARNIAYR